MDCEICLEKYDKIERKPMTIIPCGHTYCLECLSKLKRQIYKCPKCKQPISSKKPSYAVLSILDLNLVVDMNSDLKQAIQESLREVKEFKARLNVSCEKKINESQSKINLIKEEINNKTSQLMNILICNQEILFNEADNLQKSLAHSMKKIITEHDLDARMSQVNQLDRNGLLTLKEDLLKLKAELSQRLQRLNELNNNYEFRPNENLNNEMSNLIGGIFKKNFLNQKSILLPENNDTASGANRANVRLFFF